MKEQNHPNVIKIRNAHVHNLKHIDVDIPLNKIGELPECPVPESHPLHWECCMRKVHGDIWMRYRPIPEEE